MVLEYSRGRLNAEDTPLDKPLPPPSSPAWPGARSMRTASARARPSASSSTCWRPRASPPTTPATCRSSPAPHQGGRGVRPGRLGQRPLYGGSWLEGAGAVHARERGPALAGERRVRSARGRGGVFVQGGTLGNLSALVAAREAARDRSRMPEAPTRRVARGLQRRGALLDRLGGPRDGRRGRRRGGGARTACCAAPARARGTRRVRGQRFRRGRHRGLDELRHRRRHRDVARAVEGTDVWLTRRNGAYGLTGMLSPRARHRFAGVEHADSSSSTRTNGCSPRSTRAP